MKVSRAIAKSDRSFFGRMARQRGWKGGHVTYFAEDSQYMGAGSTADEAIRDLRAHRSMFAGTYRPQSEETP